MTNPFQKPRYLHDCDCCKFMGHYQKYDLYFCLRCDGGTVIARYSSEGPDYSSSPVDLLIPCALQELAYGIRHYKEKGTEERIPPRMGAPLHVAVCYALDQKHIKLSIDLKKDFCGEGVEYVPVDGVEVQS